MTVVLTVVLLTDDDDEEEPPPKMRPRKAHPPPMTSSRPPPINRTQSKVLSPSAPRGSAPAVFGTMRPVVSTKGRV